MLADCAVLHGTGPGLTHNNAVSAGQAKLRAAAFCCLVRMNECCSILLPCQNERMLDGMTLFEIHAATRDLQEVYDCITKCRIAFFHLILLYHTFVDTMLILYKYKYMGTDLVVILLTDAS